MIEKAFSNEIQKYLLSEEKILWTGKSDYKKIFCKRDVLLIPLCYIFLFWALFIELAGILMLFDPQGSLQKDSSRGLGVALSIGGIIGIILMYYLSIGRFFLKRNYKKNTIYVVTNRRVLVLSNYKACKEIIEEYINNITNIYISINKGGNGTLKFGEIYSPNKLLIKSMWIEPFIFPIEEIPVFYDIDDAEKVYTLVNSIKSNMHTI